MRAAKKRGAPLSFHGNVRWVFYWNWLRKGEQSRLQDYIALQLRLGRIRICQSLLQGGLIYRSGRGWAECGPERMRLKIERRQDGGAGDFAGEMSSKVKRRSKKQRNTGRRSQGAARNRRTPGLDHTGAVAGEKMVG